MKRSLAALAGALLFALSCGTLAQSHGSIPDRIHQMESRIERGIRAGELTRREAEQLRVELGNIRGKEHRMRSDGRLNPRERDALHADLDRLDRHITREKHDGDRRPRR